MADAITAKELSEAVVGQRLALGKLKSAILDTTEKQTAVSALATGSSQPAESTMVESFSFTPNTAGAAKFGERAMSWENTGGGAGTYNHGRFYGWNVGRHATGSVVDGKCAMIMGFESNYFDPVNSTYGPEWYVEYHSPDGSYGIRPFYCRITGSDGNTANNATVYCQIGNDGTGAFSVMKGTNPAAPETGNGILFQVNGAGASCYVPITLNGASLTCATANAGIKSKGDVSTFLSVAINQASAGQHTIVNAWGNSSNPGVTVGTTRTDGKAFQVITGATLTSGLITAEGTSVFVVTGEGDVGMGTAAPNHTANWTNLTVEGVTGAEFRLQSASGTNRAQLYSLSSGFVVGTVDALPMAFRTAAVERLSISSTGTITISAFAGLGEKFLKVNNSGQIITA